MLEICILAKLQVRQLYCIVTWSLLIRSSNAWRRSLARWALCILGLGKSEPGTVREITIFVFFVPTLLLYHQQYVTGNCRSCNNHINKKAKHLLDTRSQTKNVCCAHTHALLELLFRAVVE